MNTRREVRRHVAVFLVAVVIALSQGCVTTTGSGGAAAKSSRATIKSRVPDPFDDAQWATLAKGVSLVEQKQPAQAIAASFEPVIAAYAARHTKPDELVYSAVTGAETLTYLMQESTRTDKDEVKRTAIVVGPAWGYAWFWKGYALGELGDNVAAQAALHEALRLSPSNPHFLSELGYTYIREKRWIEALTTYESADAFALFAPEESQKEERGRAWRGQGYALVELGRYDEAEAKYRACLKLNPEDEKARGELGYVLEQKAKAKADKL